MAGIVGDIACAFAAEPVIRAEARLSLEPEFFPHIETRAGAAWEPAALELATAAADAGQLTPDFTPARLVRTLSGMPAGQRYMADLTPTDPTVLRLRFTESFDTVLAAMTTTSSHPANATDRPRRTHFAQSATWPSPMKKRSQ